MKLLLPDHLAGDLTERVCQIAPQCQIVLVRSTGELAGSVDDAEVIFLRWDMPSAAFRRLLTQVAGLRWVHTVSAGVDHILCPELTASPAVLTNASGVFSLPIAETVLAYILAVVKRLPEFQQQQRDHQWRKLELRGLSGLTVGIVGLGDIGGQVARLCRCCGMRVLGLRRHPALHPHADEVLPPDRLPDLLGRSDFVVIAAPLTAQTRGLIGQAELAAMKPDGWLINIARGAIVDEAALIEALRERRIGGACLDVFAEEPLPAESPLWDLPNVIITPHASWSAPGLDEREVELFLENLRRYVNGEPLLNVVDKNAGY